MSYNDNWAAAYSYAINQRMPTNRANNFALAYANVLSDLDTGTEVMTPEEFHHVRGENWEGDVRFMERVGP